MKIFIVITLFGVQDHLKLGKILSRKCWSIMSFFPEFSDLNR